MELVLEKEAARGQDLAEAAAVGEVEKDRRIARSKRALKDAYVSLLLERGIGGFTVNDLCTRADLNRGTFYNHFADMDELLVSLENDVIEDLRHFQEPMRNIGIAGLLRHKLTGEPFPFLVDLFDYLRVQSDFFIALLGSGGDTRFSAHLRDTVCTDLVLGVLHKDYRDAPTPFVNYYVAFYASAYLGVILQWYLTGMRESSEEMARIAMRLFLIQPGDPIEL